MNKRRSSINWAVLLVLAGIGMSCSDISTPPVESIEPDFTQARKHAENMARNLATVLNENESIQREVFSKLAYRFDGDRSILFRHLSPSALETFSTAQYKLNLQEFERYVPKAEIMMPYQENWTMNKIHQLGGIVVAYYPFGEDDRDVEEITGFDRSGQKVRITRETAPSIPYVLIRSNERTDKEGYLTLETRLKDPKTGNPIKARSVHLVDPLNYEITKAPNWTSLNLSELVPPSLPEVAYLPPCCECEEEGCGGGGGGGGGGYNGPGLQVGEFYTGNIESYETFLEGEAEIFMKVYQVYFQGYVQGSYVEFLHQDFITTPYHDYDLGGGYWLGWAIQYPWSARQKYITAFGQTIYNDVFRVQLWDLDDCCDDLISSGDFDKSTFPLWGQPWTIGPGPAQVKLFQY